MKFGASVSIVDKRRVDEILEQQQSQQSQQQQEQQEQQ